jgi:methionyl-tRNA formyltransferase
VAKPDAGALVDQQAVPIGPDETALEVSERVAAAAVTVLRRSLPGLIAGTAPAQPLDLSKGSYYGGRKPADGEFSWDWPAARIHNLVRAVAPPFPGAYARLAGRTIRVHRTQLLPAGAAPAGPALYLDGSRVLATCGDGGRLELSDAYLDDKRLDSRRFVETFGRDPVPTRPQPRAQERATSP